MNAPVSSVSLSMTSATSTVAFDYTGVNDYLNLCTKMVSKFSNLRDRDEALSLAMGALMNAYRVFMTEKLGGSFTSYANKAIHHALGDAVEKQTRADKRNLSLEALTTNEEGEEFDSLLLADGEVDYTAFDLMENFIDFLETLDEPDREIVKFRALHPSMSLSQVAIQLSTKVQGVPASQGGITKRLQKLHRQYRAFIDGDE